MLVYAAEARNQSAVVQIRVAAIISQFRLLFVVVIYSAREDLHDANHLRPTFVNLLEPETVSLTYRLPKRWLRQVVTLSWENEPYQDPLEVRLFATTDIAKQSGDSGLMRLTFRV